MDFGAVLGGKKEGRIRMPAKQNTAPRLTKISRSQFYASLFSDFMATGCKSAWLNRKKACKSAIWVLTCSPYSLGSSSCPINSAFYTHSYLETMRPASYGLPFQYYGRVSSQGSSKMKSNKRFYIELSLFTFLPCVCSSAKTVLI